MAGVGAILLWSSTVGVSRILTESLGAMTTGAAVYLLAGALGCAYVLISPTRRTKLRRLSRRYLFGCGGLFVFYTVCLYAAVGLASGRAQVLEVGVINYLWPGLTLVFSAAILRKRPRAILPLGVLMAFAGVVLVAWPPERRNWAAFEANFRANAWPYLLALACAVTWAMYSNLARRWAERAEGGGVPLFILASGLVMAAMSLLWREEPRWRLALVGALAFMATCPGLAAYVLWDLAMRRGNVTLSASAAYLTPLLSTGISCWLLGVLPPASLWVACGLVVGGALLCKLGIREDTGIR